MVCISQIRRISMVIAISVASCAIAWSQEAASAPVVVDGQTLFVVQADLGPFTAQDRAAATAERISRLATDLTASLDAIAAVAGDTSTDITLGDRVLFTVTDADAAAASSTREALAAAHIQAVRAAIERLRAEYSSKSLLRGALEALLSTALLVALLIALKRLRTAAIKKLMASKIGSLHVQSVELVSTRQIKRGLVQAVKLVRALLVLTALYLYLPLVLSLFPWTRAYAPMLLAYIVTPIQSGMIAVLEYLPSLFVVVLSSAVAYALIRTSQILFRSVGEGAISWPGFYPEWASPTHKIVRFLILAFTVVIVFPYLPGSGSPAFQGVSIFLGILLSLGSTSAVANIIAGVILTYTRAFHLGDRVKIADTVGDVVEKTLLATRIQTIKNEFITIPNAMVLSSHIINFSSFAEVSPLVLHSTVTIGYDAPWRQVHELLIAAALRTPGILTDPAPFVLQTSLDDFYVSYQINIHTPDPSRMAVTYSELNKNIQDCFNEAGVEIMSPHYGSLRDGNATAIPDQYRPKDYDAPAFRIKPAFRSKKDTPHA